MARMRIPRLGLLLMLLVPGIGRGEPPASQPRRYFAIEVVDEQTGRGVPMVELETVHHVVYVTDSAGWVAFNEPGLMNQQVYFTVRSHGYTMAADGFGYRGRGFKTVPGGRGEIRIERRNLAERLYRITGAGIYRDSELLGIKPPIDAPLINGQVLGQDTVMAAEYRDKVFWFWGDTLRPQHPLGMFRTSGATSLPPNRGGLPAERGINLTYFVDAEGRSRAMCEHPAKDGIIWVDGLCVVPDDGGRQRLVAHYSRRKDLATQLEHGLMLYNDQEERFDVWQRLDAGNTWRHPRGQVLRARENETDYLIFSSPMPTVRVPARLAAVGDPGAYQAFGLWDEDDWHPLTTPRALPRDAAKTLRWRWGSTIVPISPRTEQTLIGEKRMQPGETRFLPRDADGKPVLIHAASVHWNAYRRAWMMIGEQYAGTSLMGEIWFSLAESPTGPWRWAHKIVTHDRYTFYNPAHHPFFDSDDGRLVYFEGTYTHTFSGNPDTTPRYEYNQVMYRLDLSDPRLAPLEPKEARKTR